MTLTDIKKAVVEAIKGMFSAHKVYAAEVKEGFQKPAFFVEVIPVSIQNRIYYKVISLTVNIRYFPEEETYQEIINVAEGLSELFGKTLSVNERVLTIEGAENETTDEDGNKYLQFSFDLKYQAGAEVLEVEIETEQGTETKIMLPNPSRGYAEDNIELMGELVLNDVEG